MTSFILTAARFPEMTITAPAQRPGLFKSVLNSVARFRTLKTLRKLDSDRLDDIGLTKADIYGSRAGQFMSQR